MLRLTKLGLLSLALSHISCVSTFQFVKIRIGGIRTMMVNPIHDRPNNCYRSNVIHQDHRRLQLVRCKSDFKLSLAASESPGDLKELNNSSNMDARSARLQVDIGIAMASVLFFILFFMILSLEIGTIYVISLTYG